MARPTSKPELLAAAAQGAADLDALIDGMTPAEQEGELVFPASTTRTEAHWQRDRSVRDVLAHLAAWHELLLNWVASNEAGDERPFLPAPYSWRDCVPMNVAFRDAATQLSLREARTRFATSHAQVIALIERHTEAELFEKRHFTWTGTTSLGSYCVSATSAHTRWATTKLRAYLRAVRAA
ncbi:ClbS/DfsB family four-helix bundle protein [Leucobacter chromiireducens]|uniref:ClbS/DfsB family four-helix bundle protein n=1 Tax=Leucobacter chromiireducens TaxID=283877 RepID=UPI003F7E7E4A